MPLRIRLAVWYGSFFAGILLLVTMFSYGFHARGHYDDLDRALVSSALHTASEITDIKAPFQLTEGNDRFRVIIHVYTASGAQLAVTAGSPAVPERDPRAILKAPGGPSFDPIAGLAPPVIAVNAPVGSAFGIAFAGKDRWRLFVLPLHQGTKTIGYIEAQVDLAPVDASMATFRLMLAGLCLLGLGIAFVGGGIVAGIALRPVAAVIATAHSIEQERDLSRRLDLPPHQDELGQLAQTFNAMLDSLEAMHQAQQRFVADASHELRAPLTAISANLELMRHYPQMSANERDEALAEAEREATRLGRLVSDLLALARADAGSHITHATIDLDVVVLDAFKVARTLAQGHTLTLRSFEPARIMGDADRLKQLLVILLDNAIKYTPATGTIRLGMVCHEEEVEIKVQDDGVGIAPNDLPYVFDRFFRADPARGRDPGGTGLGLAIAQWIVEQHDGSIRLESTLGHGTMVVVTLPRLVLAESETALAAGV